MKAKPKCPHCCSEMGSSIIDSRPAVIGVRRRRVCENCQTRFTTVEVTIVGSEEMGNSAAAYGVILIETGTKLVVEAIRKKRAWNAAFARKSREHIRNCQLED